VITMGWEAPDTTIWIRSILPKVVTYLFTTKTFGEHQWTITVQHRNGADDLLGK
jgi:hypothetical protein